MSAYIMRIKGDERGAVTALTALLVTVLLLVCALVVDLGGAFILKNEQAGLAQLAREEKMTPSSTLLIKNSEQPGLDIALMIADSLRTNGFDDEIVVYFYELDEATTGKADRFYAYGIELRSTYHTTFGATVGQPEIDVSTMIVSSAQPYSEYEVWRPSSTYNGCWTFASGSSATSYSFTSMTFTQMPQEIQDEIDSF